MIQDSKFKNYPMASHPSLPAAIIFDLDGVLVDSSPFHFRKWVDFLRNHAIPFDEGELPNIVLGPANDVIFRRFLGDHLTRKQISQLSEELDANFRREIGPNPPALPGVRRFIEECHTQGVVMAVASAAIASNVKFLVDALGFRPFFREVLAVDSTTNPKPHPDIYLKVADKLGVQPSACAVFEDSYVGIEAAKRAGMKCIGISSTFSAADLRRNTQADMIVPNFEPVSLETVRELFHRAQPE
jgi:HAD superfamily hydrolase (TIGR01509 family)